MNCPGYSTACKDEQYNNNRFILILNSLPRQVTFKGITSNIEDEKIITEYHLRL